MSTYIWRGRGGSVRYTVLWVSYRIPYWKLRYDKTPYRYRTEFFGIPEFGTPEIRYGSFLYRYRTMFPVHRTAFRYTILLRYTELGYDIPLYRKNNTILYLKYIKKKTILLFNYFKKYKTIKLLTVILIFKFIKLWQPNQK